LRRLIMSLRLFKDSLPAGELKPVTRVMKPVSPSDSKMPQGWWH
jgi:hypothetical protein